MSSQHASFVPCSNERVYPLRLAVYEDSPWLRNVDDTEVLDKISVVPVDRGNPGFQAAPESSYLGVQPEITAEQQQNNLKQSGLQENNEVSEPTQEHAPPGPTQEVEMTDGTAESSFLPQAPSQDSQPTNSGSLVSDKFEYAILDDGTHGVIHGTRRAFTRCEDELIHIPGAIQSYGMLVALKHKPKENVYVPRIVSENSHYICRYQPLDIFSFDSFDQLMPLYQRALFKAQMKHLLRVYEGSGKEQEPVVFAFSFFDPQGRLIPCWCAAHYLGGKTDLYVCEFELQDYSMHPLASGMTEPPEPVDTLGSDHMDVATVSSLHSRSKPVFTNKDLYQGIEPSMSSVEVVGIAAKIQIEFSEAVSVPDLLEKIVGVVSEISRFNRVMVYQFDQEFNGTVVAEYMDPKTSLDIYRGLHFPHTDIPPQARRLYMVNKVRVLFDRTQQTARLVGKSKIDIDVPLDLTHAYLRAISPVHLKYLGNMKVRSSMSMSLESEGQLWGLIVCHSYGATATRVPFSIRELSHFIGLTASTCLQKLLNAGKLQARRIIETLQARKNPNECITASSDELLKLFEADCGFLVIEGEARTIGRLSSYTETVTVLKYLVELRRPPTILHSSNIREDFKDLYYPGGFKSIAGVLYIPLSGNKDDCVVFFRRNQLREVHWAGRPNLKEKFGDLEPRNSFKKWTEVVDGTSTGWTLEQDNMAAMAQVVYGSFIRVWREKEAAVKETQLRKLLLHDASHKMRTPLNAVINYLEMALEKPLEPNTKHELEESYQQSKSLIFVIDDLLNITGNNTGSQPRANAPFDLSACMEEALDPLKRLARGKGVDVVVRPPAVTRYLQGDPPQLQRAVTVLVANAIEHTSNVGRIIIEWNEAARKKPKSLWVRISVSDSGEGLSERELDDMFQVFEEVSDENVVEGSEHVPVFSRDGLQVGVGLAFVARFVKGEGGRLKVKSVKGEGSTFAIELPFSPASRAPSLVSRRDASPLPNLPMPMPGPDRTALAESESGAPANSSTAPMAMSSMALSSMALSVTDTVMSPPIVAPTSSASPMGRGETPYSHMGGLCTILVADDNVINIKILDKRLTKMGHRVLVSRNGQECFDMFALNQATIDFILMDLNMPVVDGFASTRMIREREQTHPTPSRVVQACNRVPIFAVSGMLRRGEEQRYIDAQFDGWVPKPLNMRRLAACFAGALDPSVRKQGVYDPADFDAGGWFRHRVQETHWRLIDFASPAPPFPFVPGDGRDSESCTPLASAVERPDPIASFVDDAREATQHTAISPLAQTASTNGVTGSQDSDDPVSAPSEDVPQPSALTAPEKIPPHMDSFTSHQASAVPADIVEPAPTNDVTGSQDDPMPTLAEGISQGIALTSPVPPHVDSFTSHQAGSAPIPEDIVEPFAEPTTASNILAGAVTPQLSSTTLSPMDDVISTTSTVVQLGSSSGASNVSAQVIDERLDEVGSEAAA